MNELCFEGNVARRLERGKEFFTKAEGVEKILGDWLNRFCQLWVDEEFEEQIGAGYYERTFQRRDVRHGRYPRQLITSRGVIELQVPRGHRGKYVFRLFEAYRRSSAAFEEAVIESVLLGHSTRKSRRFFKQLIGQDVVSQQTASRLLRRFDVELAQWRRRPLPKELAIVVLDAVHLKGSREGVRSACPVLVALGIYPDGREEILDFCAAASESQISWERFCQRLVNRGLQKVQLIVHDEQKAIAQAVALCWPESLDQLCVFHVLRNLSNNLRGYVGRKKIMHWAQWLYQAQSLEEFERWGRMFKKKFKNWLWLAPVRRFIELWPHTSQYFKLPRSWWEAAKTSNLLERYFEEIRRRFKTFGRSPNPASCERWFFALSKRFNQANQRVKGWKLLTESTQF